MFLWSTEGKQSVHSPVHRVREDSTAPAAPHRLKHHLSDCSWSGNLCLMFLKMCVPTQKATVRARSLYPFVATRFSCIEKNH